MKRKDEFLNTYFIITGFLFTILAWVYVAFNFSDLPDKIVGHMDLNGNVNLDGDKNYKVTGNRENRNVTINSNNHTVTFDQHTDDDARNKKVTFKKGDNTTISSITINDNIITYI